MALSLFPTHIVPWTRKLKQLLDYVLALNTFNEQLYISNYHLISYAYSICICRIVIYSIIFVLVATHNILDFGAIENDATWFAENGNARAIERAIMAAHNKDKGDNTVVIPEGIIISSLPIKAEDVQGIEIIIDGILKVSKNYHAY